MNLNQLEDQIRVGLVAGVYSPKEILALATCTELSNKFRQYVNEHYGEQILAGFLANEAIRHERERK